MDAVVILAMATTPKETVRATTALATPAQLTTQPTALRTIQLLVDSTPARITTLATIAYPLTKVTQFMQARLVSSMDTTVRFTTVKPATQATLESFSLPQTWLARS